jgi:hypothetical protein
MENDMKTRLIALALFVLVLTAAMVGAVGPALALAPPPTPASLGFSQSTTGTAWWYGATGMWTNQDISITSTPTMSLLGTSTIIVPSYFAYSLNGGPAVDITSGMKHTFTAEGVYRLDAAGTLNLISYEATNAVLRIDKTRPTSWSNAVPVYDAAAAITISATDALSGASSIAYSLDGASDFATPTAPYGGTHDLTSTVNVVAPGWHNLRWFAVDLAGNHDNAHYISFLVNAPGDKPVLGKPKVSVRKGHTTTVKGSVTPAATARVLVVTVQRKGKTWKTVATFRVTVPKYASAYSMTKYLSKKGTCRVYATEGTGVSKNSNSFVIR